DTIDFNYNDSTPSITADVKPDSINDTHIDFGTGTNQVNTDDLPEGSTNLYFTNERAQDAVGHAVGAGLAYDDNTGAISSTITQYTDELAQDAVGNILADSNTIDLTYNDTTPSIGADVKTQMSITADANGLMLDGDEASPGN